MWWNSSSYGRHHTPSTASVSPIPFSSNQELFEDPDPDWVGGQLEQARLQRSGFYRRLQSASHRGSDETVTLQNSRRLSPDGTDETESLPSFEPHTSWRFYTSFDNGEWRRHAVPVLKAEEATATKSRGYTPKSRESEVRRSADVVCQAAESSLRRARHPRTTAADRQQARLRMRLGDTVENSPVYGRWRLSSSTENVRNTAIGGSMVDIRGSSPEAYHQGFNFRNVSQVLSPSSDRLSQWDEATSPVGLLPRPSFDSGSPPKAVLPAGSCIVDGKDVTFQEKFIVPTKYKNRETNTATGTPETSKTEVPSSTSAEFESRNITEVLRKDVDATCVSCMTGQGEVQAVKSSEQREVVLFGRVGQTHQESGESRVKKKPTGVTSVRSTAELDLTCDPKLDQIAIVSRFIREDTFNQFLESCRITTDDNQKFKPQVTYSIPNGITKDTPNPEPNVEKNEIVLQRKELVLEDSPSSKTDADDVSNNFETLSGRGQVVGAKLTGQQKADLTANMTEKIEITLNENQKSVCDTNSSKANSDDARNNFETSRGRSLAVGAKLRGQQKAELTVKLTEKNEITLNQNQKNLGDILNSSKRNPNDARNNFETSSGRGQVVGAKLSGQQKAELTANMTEKKEITLNQNQKSVCDTNSSRANSDDARNNFETSSGRSLSDGAKCEQKTELTANMAASLLTADLKKVSDSGDKIVKFVSTFFAKVNEGLNKEPLNTKNKSGNFVVPDAIGQSPGPVETRVVDSVSNDDIDEDDNWIIEMAVKI